MKLLRYWKAKREATHQLMLAHATHRAVMDVFHEMVASIGIEEMEKLLNKAKQGGMNYVSLAEWYIETLRKRRNQL